MRVADRSTARNYLKYLNKARSDYAATNERIASGNRFTKISDDVSSGSRVLQAKSDMYKVDKQLSNVKDINDELTTTENALSSIGDILNNAHGVIKKGQNGDKIGNESDRKIIAGELESMQKEMLAFLNTQYSSKYVMGGTNYESPPFTVDKDTNKLLYNGIAVDDIQKDTDGYFYMKEGVREEIPMDGDVYMDIGLGIKMSGPDVDPTTGFKISYSGLDIVGFGTDADGKSNNVYNTITEIVEKLKAGDVDGVSDADTKLTTLTDNFRANVTDIGAKTLFLGTMQGRLEKNVDSYTTKIFNLMGTNDAEEAANQSMNDYVLKAVIQMGARILPVSLMDYLR